MQTTFAGGNGALQNIFIGYYDARGVCTVVNDETEAGIAAVITILRLAGGLIAMIFQNCPREGLLLSTTLLRIVKIILSEIRMIMVILFQKLAYWFIILVVKMLQQTP